MMSQWMPYASSFGNHSGNRTPGGRIATDYDAEGRLAGIEVLDVLERFGDPKVLRQVILEDVGLVRA